MEVAETPNLDLGAKNRVKVMNMATQEGDERSTDATDKSSNFVIDMERLLHSPNKNVITNYSITGGNWRKTNTDVADRWDADSLVAKSNTVPVAVVGSIDKLPNPMVFGGDNSPRNVQIHHHVAVTTTSSDIPRYAIKRSLCRRSSFSWVLNPKRILFFFATLSSMGTILLIYFTLSINNVGGVNGNGLDS